MSWVTYKGAQLKMPIKSQVENTILEEIANGNRLKICIGTDSSVSHGHIEYATVILFLRERKGGFMYIQRDKERCSISIKERMIREVVKSVEVAYELSSLFDKYEVELEVHADINSDPSFKSNVAFKEAMGYIMGMGYTFRAKPDAYASSCCADRVV